MLCARHLLLTVEPRLILRVRSHEKFPGRIIVRWTSTRVNTQFETYAENW